MALVCLVHSNTLLEFGRRENVELLIKYGADLESMREKYKFSFIKLIDKHLIYGPIKNDNVACLKLMQDYELNLKFYYEEPYSYEEENSLHFAIQKKSLKCYQNFDVRS